MMATKQFKFEDSGDKTLFVSATRSAPSTIIGGGVESRSGSLYSFIRDDVG